MLSDYLLPILEHPQIFRDDEHVFILDEPKVSEAVLRHFEVHRITLFGDGLTIYLIDIE